eukprot:1100731-Amphidinium_carterae.1
MGEQPFLETWLQSKTTELLRQIQKLTEVPTAVSPGKAGGMQAAYTLLRSQYPAKVLHLMRAMPTHQMQPLLKDIDDALCDTLATWLGEERLQAQQVRVAQLPVVLGGVGLPKHRTLAPIARAAALYTAARNTAAAAEFLTHLCREEQPDLHNRLLNLVDQPPLLNLDSRPQG